MSDKNKTTILKAFRLLLQPLTRILLRSGITWKEAAEVCKTSFVEVATNEFGLHGRPTNISRVAIMTGLGRRDVSRLRKLIDSEELPDLGKMNNATRVLTGWHLDPDYLTDTGVPRTIPFEGDNVSFSALTRKYAGDIAPITMLRELLRVGAVKERADGVLQVLMRYYMPLQMDADAIFRAGSALRDLGNTIDYDLVRNPISQRGSRAAQRTQMFEVSMCRRSGLFSKLKGRHCWKGRTNGCRGTNLPRILEENTGQLELVSEFIKFRMTNVRGIELIKVTVPLISHLKRASDFDQVAVPGARRSRRCPIH